MTWTLTSSSAVPSRRDIKPPPAATVSVVHPSVILSRVEYVDELFKLLAMSGSDTQLSEKCWQLLMRLDINAQLLLRLHTLDESHTDWAALLDGRNVAKLQYSLIIVRMLMLGHAQPVSAATAGGKVGLRVEVDGNGEQKQRAGDEWQRRFLIQGGVAHLLHVLVSTDILADAIPLQQTSTQPSASCLSFHQSLALLCVMSLLAICTDVLRNPNVKARHDRPTVQSGSTSSMSTPVPTTTAPPSPTPQPVTELNIIVTAPTPAVASELLGDVDMASESATRKRKEALDAIQQPAKKLKAAEDTAVPDASPATGDATTPSDTTAAVDQPHSLFTPQLISKLLAVMLHCAALPLYQPALTKSTHSRSSDVLSSVLRDMDGRIAEAALYVEKILPPSNAISASVAFASATASPSYIDSPTTAIAELALPSPSATAAISPLSPLYGPSFDPHRDEVSGVYSACVALLQHIASEVSTAQLDPFVSAQAIAALGRTALLCSPRSCIRQCTNVLLLQLCCAAHRPPPPSLAATTQPTEQTLYPLPQLMFRSLLQLLTATPLSDLQGRWRHQTEPLFSVMLRLTNDYLWCDIDPSTQPPPSPAQQQHPTQQPQHAQRVHISTVLELLFHLIQRVTAERETDATADQTAVGLLWLTALLVQLQHRLDTHKPPSPPRLHGEHTPYPYDTQHHSSLATYVAQCGIIPFLYTKGLFQVRPVHSAADLQSLATSPLFRFSSTRQAALELLIGLSFTSGASHTTLLSLSLQSHPHRADLVANSQYNYQPSLQRKPAACPHVGLHNLGATCFPERDTRILTDRGFLFLHEIEQCNEEVLYACYDVATASIVYRRGTVVYAATPERWVDFTQSDTQRHWSRGSSDYIATRREVDGNCATHLTLRTTPQHDMYVQPCAEPHNAYEALSAACKVRAEELTPGYRCGCSTTGERCIHGWPSYRMFTGAHNGVQSPRTISLCDTAKDSPVSALDLCSEDELAAFLCLYGYWLSDGTLAYDQDDTLGVNAVCFPLFDKHDRTRLLEWLARLPLKEGRDWTVDNLELRAPICIINSEWFRFFYDEFGCMYPHSSRFDADLALHKQGMQSASQQLPLRPPHSTALDKDDNEGVLFTSTKWMPEWVVHRLSKRCLQNVLSGMRHSNTADSTQRHICATDIALRDQLVQACLHAGFSAYFTLGTRAGEVTGYRLASKGHATVCSEVEMKALQRSDPAHRFTPVVSRYDSWCVVYSDSVSHILAAEDIRFDGKPAKLHSRSTKKASAALVAVPTEPSDEYQLADGRAWCVEVQHVDHLIIVQRAHTNQQGVVTKVGRAVITSNCYMNSLMQQLYFTPPFRYGLFVQRHWDAMAKDSTECSSSVVYQMQLLMGQLQESVQRFYDARSFCSAYRDYEGGCMALNTQMDVQEFANILFDQLEKELKTTHSHQLQLLNHVYGGKIVNQLICQQCNNRNERDEDYYMLSLDVKNKHSILNSLSLYTEGELLEGDNKASCSRCNRKTETVKRVCVKTLPPHLILHLKRFEFDLDSMRKYKVNDYCEFPMELDLFPYTKEGIEARERKADDEKDDSSKDATPVQPPPYYQYTLSGVLVHTGTCNSGHYYSFVKDRTADGGWWSCNDTNVEVLNVDTIKESCYGGGEVVNTYDVHTRKPVTNFISKPYSAYMLFYDRVECREGKGVEPPAVKEEVKAEVVSTAMQVDNDLTTSTTTPDAAPVVDRDVLAVSPPSALPDLLSTEHAASLVPPLIFRSIWSDNAVFLSDCYIFDAPYFHFAYRLIKSGVDWWQAVPQQQRDERLQRYKTEENVMTTDILIDLHHSTPHQPPPATDAPLLWSDDLLFHSGKFAIHFLLHTYVHARCKSVMEGWDGWLRQMMDASYRLSCYLLSSMAVQRDWMRALVLLSGVPSFRSKWNDIVLAAMLKCQAVYDERYDAAKQRGGVDLPPRSLHPYIADYLHVYLSLLPNDVQENIKNAHTYFSFLLAFLQTPNQPHFTAFLLRYPRLVTTLLQFFLSSDSECPTTGVPYARHQVVLFNSLRDGRTPLVAVSQDTRVLMSDGGAKIARMVQEGESLLSETGAERRVEEVVQFDDEVEEDEPEVDEADDTARTASGERSKCRAAWTTCWLTWR